MDLYTKGWLLIGSGIVIRYFIARRRFNRRGVGGMQHFRSFERGVLITFFEWVFRWGAILMMLYGFFVLLAGISERDKVSKQAAQERSKEKPPAK